MILRRILLALVFLSGASASAVEPVTAADARKPTWAAATPVTAQTLQRLRGGSDAGTPTTQTSLEGSVGQNQAVNVSSGQNVINGGAFANMSGVPVVIQNSGSNVLIQNATVVNVTVR